MQRTHLPRGYIWNCTSAFQQTELFRDISYDEAEHVPSPDELLEPADDDDFRLPERDAKRRRVEKLADDFLNGLTLEIHSATLDPNSVDNAVLYSCFDRPRDGWDALKAVDLERLAPGDDVWEDVESDQDILRAFITSHEGDPNASHIGLGGSTHSFSELVVTEVQAQASRGAKTRLRSARLATGPSEDALARAAQLRNRRLQKPSLLDPQPQSCPHPAIPETQVQSSYTETQDETVSDCGPSPTPAWTSSKWLKTRAFKLPKREVDEDCSKDELGATTILSQSQRTRTRSRPLARTRSAISTSSNPSFNAPPVPTASTVASLQSTAPEAEGQDQTTAVEYAPEAVDKQQAMLTEESGETPLIQESSRTHGEDEQSDADSQAQLLKKQGVHVRPRKSWATTNVVLEHAADQQESNDQSDDGRLMPSAVRSSLLQSAQEIAGKASKSRKARSAGATPVQTGKEKSSRRRTAPAESQQADDGSADAIADRPSRAGIFRAEYTAIENKDGSPFMFRKRASRTNKEGDSTVGLDSTNGKPPRKTRTKVAFPSSDSPQVTRTGVVGAEAQGLEPAIAPSPQTPLVNEHLNKILPRDASSEQQSSSVRRALREELKASGAEILRCADGPRSSQLEKAQTQQDPSVSGQDLFQVGQIEAARAAIESQGQLWPGTQAMLFQAQKNLCTSPDKTNTALYLGDKSMPQAGSGAEKANRPPLKQLSQERLPLQSTQALLADWQGWSSVKKPVSDARRSSFGQSPSIGKGLSKLIASDPAPVREPADRRGSSLRYSMSFSDMAEPSPYKDIGIDQVSIPPPQITQKNHSDGFLKPALKRTSGGTASSLSFGYLSLDPQKQSETLDHEIDHDQDDALAPSRDASKENNGGTTSSLSFGYSSGDPLGQTGNGGHTYPAPTDTVFSPEEPMTSYQNAQNPGEPAVPVGGEDSQLLYQDITDIADDILGSATGFDSF